MPLYNMMKIKLNETPIDGEQVQKVKLPKQVFLQHIMSELVAGCHFLFISIRFWWRVYRFLSSIKYFPWRAIGLNASQMAEYTLDKTKKSQIIIKILEG